MSDLGWYLAGALGFALVCVIGVVWMLSKRTVQVNQHQENHAAPVTVNAVTETGGNGIAPALIGGVVKLLVALMVLAMIVSAVSNLGSGLQSIGSGLSQQAAPKQVQIVMPTPIPTVRPVATASPIVIHETTVINPLPMVVAVLAAAAAAVWGYVVVTLLRRRPVARPNVISGTRQVSAREVFGVAPSVRTKETVKNR